MTAVLVPAGGDTGGRGVTYRAEVDGRSAGRLRLVAAGHGEGLLEDVSVRAADAPAVLAAAREALAGWGLRRAQVVVRGADQVGRDFATAAGLALTSANLRKPVTVEPAEPPVGARPMTESEYARFRDRDQDSYERDLVDSGTLDPAGARAKAAADWATSLPHGRHTPGNLLLTLVARVDGAARRVGTLWLAVDRPDPGVLWVYQVDIEAAHRGRGLGRAAMLLAEREAVRAGQRAVALNVFGHNRVARGLYDSLGYLPTVEVFG
ncbi:MAG: GNAT family N-acetyltransferase [Mycobacteriales bacterium]